MYMANKRQMKNFVFRSLEVTLKNTPSPLICHLSSVPSASRIRLLENCVTMPRFSGSEASVEAVSRPFGLALFISLIGLIID